MSHISIAVMTRCQRVFHIGAGGRQSKWSLSKLRFEQLPLQHHYYILVVVVFGYVKHYARNASRERQALATAASSQERCVGTRERNLGGTRKEDHCLIAACTHVRHAELTSPMQSNFARLPKATSATDSYVEPPDLLEQDLQHGEQA